MSSRHAGTSDHAQLLIGTHGNAADPRMKSGLPFHLLAESRRQGLDVGALPLTPTTSARYRVHRALWNARRVLAGHPRGGYQYSCPALELEWEPVRHRAGSMRVLHCHQLLPPSLLEKCAPRTWFYVDMTLRQVFGSRYERRSLGDVATRAVELERAGYHAAPAVITRSHWAAASVVTDYGVDPAKVHVVLPGANLDHRTYESWASQEDRRRRQYGTRQGPVRFVYVGYDWRRKGLDRLLRAHALARARGSTAVVRVIGCARGSLPSDLRDVAGVEWCGIIDKRNDAATFVRLVAEGDVGCLVSHEEAAGISLREFGALGLAVVATTAGGAAENARGEAAVLVDPTDSDEVLADLLVRLAADRDWRESLRAASWERREECSWAAAVERLRTIISSSPSPSASVTSALLAKRDGGI